MPGGNAYRAPEDTRIGEQGSFHADMWPPPAPSPDFAIRTQERHYSATTHRERPEFSRGHQARAANSIQSRGFSSETKLVQEQAVFCHRNATSQQGVPYETGGGSYAAPRQPQVSPLMHSGNNYQPFCSAPQVADPRHTQQFPAHKVTSTVPANVRSMSPMSRAQRASASPPLPTVSGFEPPSSGMEPVSDVKCAPVSARANNMSFTPSVPVLPAEFGRDGCHQCEHLIRQNRELANRVRELEKVSSFEQQLDDQTSFSKLFLPSSCTQPSSSGKKEVRFDSKTSEVDSRFANQVVEELQSSLQKRDHELQAFIQMNSELEKKVSDLEKQLSAPSGRARLRSRSPMARATETATNKIPLQCPNVATQAPTARVTGRKSEQQITLVKLSTQRMSVSPSPRRSRASMKAEEDAEGRNEQHEEEVRVLQLELMANEKQIRKLVKENKTLKESASKHESKCEDVEKLKSEAMKHKMQCEALKVKVTKLETQVMERANTKAEKWSMNETNKNAEVGELRKELKHLQAYNDKITTELFQLRVERSRQESDVERLEAAVNEKLTLAKSRRGSNNSRSSMSSKSSILRETREKWQDAEMRLTRMEAQHDAEMNELRHKLNKELEEEKASDGDVDKRRKSVDNDSVAALNSELKAEIAVLKEQNAAASEKHATEVADLKRQTEDVRHMFQKELESMKKSNKSSGRGGGAAQGGNDTGKLEKEMEHLKEAHAAEIELLTQREEQMQKAFQKELDNAKAEAAAAGTRTAKSDTSLQDSDRNGDLDDSSPTDKRGNFAEVERYQREVSEMKKQMWVQEESHKAETTKMHLGFQKELEDAKTRASASGDSSAVKKVQQQMEDMKERHQMEVADLERKSAEMRCAFQKEVEEAKAQAGASGNCSAVEGVQKQMEEMKAKHEMEVADLDLKSAEMRRAFQKELEEAKAQASAPGDGSTAERMQKQMQEMAANHEMEVADLKHQAVQMRRAFQKELEEAKTQTGAPGDGPAAEGMQKQIEEMTANHEMEVADLKHQAVQMRRAFQKELEEAKAQACASGDGSPTEGMQKQMKEMKENHEMEVADLKRQADEMRLAFQKEVGKTKSRAGPAEESSGTDSKNHEKEIEKLRQNHELEIENLRQREDQMRKAFKKELEQAKEEMSSGNTRTTVSGLDDVHQKLRAAEIESEMRAKEMMQWKDSYAAQQKEIDKLRRAQSAGARDTQEVEALKRAHDAEISALQQQLEVRTSNSATLEAVHSERDELTRENQRLRQEVLELQAVKQQVEGLEAERQGVADSSMVSSHQGDNAQMDEEIKSLKTKLNLASQAQSRYFRASKEIEVLRRKVKEQEEAMQNMNQPVVDTLLEEKNAAQIQEMERMINELRRQNQDFKEQMNDASRAERELELEEREANLLNEKRTDADGTVKLLSSTQQLLAQKEDALIEKDAEIARLRELLDKHQSPEEYPEPEEMRTPAALGSFYSTYPSSMYSNNNSYRAKMPASSASFHHPTDKTHRSSSLDGRGFGRQFTIESMKRRRETVEHVLENWDSDWLANMIKSRFEECDVGNKDYLDWNSGECREFLLSLFRGHNLPPPEFPLVVFRQIYTEVKDDHGSSDTLGLNVKEASAFAKRVHIMIKDYRPEFNLQKENKRRGKRGLTRLDSSTSLGG